MRSSCLGRYALSSCVAAAILAGCGGSQPPIGAPGAMPQGRAAPTHAAHGRSWMLPEAKKNDLVYISNGSYGVEVYTWKGSLVGELEGFVGVDFMCVDKAGDIFIPSPGTEQIFEYAHGGTSPIATLNDPSYGGQARACATDPTTGNLAVENVYTNGGAANVLIYQHATGTPQIYSDPNFWFYDFCAYDDAGNLFIGGNAEVGYFEFAELPTGQKRFRGIALDKIPEQFMGLQWVGNYLAVGTGARYDYPDTSYIYHMKISGNIGTTIGTTTLTKSPSPVNFFIQGTEVVLTHDLTELDFEYFHYPAGGAAIKEISQTQLTVGVVVSKGSNSR